MLDLWIPLAPFPSGALSYTSGRSFVLWTVFGLAALAGCDASGPLSPSAEVSGASLGLAAVAPGQDLITSDAAAFAQALRDIGNENEVIVVMKDAAVPRVAAEFLQSLPLDAPLVVARPSLPGPTRSVAGFARVGDTARGGVVTALSALGIVPYRAAPWAPVLCVRIPDAMLEPVLAALLALPTVDYLEANQRRPVTFDAGPQGSNPAGDQHTFHNVLQAWDYTRGAGARVGILDSGFAFDLYGTGQPHPDGLLLSSTRGIQANGFVDDYDAYNNCDRNGLQPSGGCPPWDDKGHGTRMAGVVGANDNDINAVGVMPDGLTVSMKVAQNCNLSNDGCGSDTFRIEDDDIVWAVTWAGTPEGNIDVLSMSFSGSLGSSTYNAMYDAYHQDDILLVSSTGNRASEQREPQEWPFVMGVGGINIDGSNHGNKEHEEVSGLAQNLLTLGASCPSPGAFCTPSGSGTTSATSGATAIVAAIAGLVRSHEPWISAPALRQRLRATSSGSRHKVEAVAALLNRVPLSASISGLSYITTAGTYTWSAQVTGGQGGYAYQWSRTDEFGTPVVVSTGSTYSEYVAPDGSSFHLTLTVTSGSETVTVGHSVQTSPSDCGTQLSC